MKTTYLYIIGVAVLFVGLVVFAQYSGTTSSSVVANTEYDDFSQCLSDAGAMFFGAFWCPHCQEQKKLLKNSKNIPYTECSTPDGQSQIQVCEDEGITGYPTWRFANGDELNGVQQLSVLGEQTGCEVPQL